ncbi:MAG TPA: heterodisulfide reductase-related iron-sulfur binding cluster, partial [Candidatus Thermoplasmatota archaeon]|nr:heterodisulfide reductase-related iron-sulfur binding cluster [Candidatus Thermoplasmatota archaeon]
TFEGPDLALVNDAHGITGFLVEITLRVRPASTDTPILATFADDDGERAAGAVRAIGESHAAWNVSWYTPEFTELLNEAGGAKLLPAGKHSVLVTLEGDGRKPDVVRILQAEGGEVGKDEAAQKAWDARFDHLNFKRLGPSVLVAESVIDGIGLWKAVEASLAVTRVERQCVWVIGVAPDRYDVIWYALDDERRMEFAPALGNSLAVMHAVKKLGGRSYGTGVLLASEAGHVYGKERLRRWKEFKKEHDRDELFNPGPVLGARMRGAPVRIFSTVMKAQGPLLRGARGTAGKWPGGPLADPGFLAKHAALGRERAGDLAEVDYAATTCIFCGFCDSVAPERARVHWETEMPRGRVQLAVAHLRGRAEYTREGQRKVLRNPLSYQREAICPTRIPIDRVTDLLAGAFGAALGPLQEHEALVANVKQHGNVQGKPREARAKWAAFPVTPDATTLLVVDDAGSYDAPDVAAAAAAALTNAQVALAYLGAKEPSVGTVLVETGNRDAARETATSLLQEAAKRRLRTVVTPDANAWRVLRLDYPLFARDLGTTWDVDVRHSTEVLAEAVKSKRLTLETPWPKKAVVHVPEALAGKARDAVVDLAKAIPGATILPWGGDCCGHGRALHLTDPEMQTAAAERMLKEAIAVGAEAVLTANPGCAALLKSVAKKAKAGVEVIDLHEVVARSMTMAAAG